MKQLDITIVCIIGLCMVVFAVFMKIQSNDTTNEHIIYQSKQKQTIHQLIEKGEPDIIWVEDSLNNIIQLKIKE